MPARSAGLPSPKLHSRADGPRRDHVSMVDAFISLFQVLLLIEFSTDRGPRAIGPYSQAVSSGNLVFASGQIPIDPATGEFVAGGIAEQTEQVMRNLRAVFEAAGVELSQVIKTTVFLADMDEFSAMNEIYGRFFGENPPARATVQAARLPRDARVEIDAIAVIEG